MGIRQSLSKESIINGFKSLGKLRVKVSHGSILAIATLLVILFVAFTIRLLPIRWEIQTGAVHISEFDPYYYFTLSRYMVNNGLISPYWPTQWIDHQRWYPDGINMGMSLPGLPMTEAVMYSIISGLGVNIDLMSFVAFFPAIMGTIACFVIYFVGKDWGGRTVGLLSALFLALSPAYISRTSLGFADDETTGIVALLLFVLMFLRAIEQERPMSSTIKYSIGSGLALAYFISSWGAAYYALGLTALFVFVLMVLRRYTSRLFLSYSVTFGLGLFIAINIPYISTSYLFSAAVLPVAGVFVLLFFNEVTRNVKSAQSKVLLVGVLFVLLVGGFVLLWQLGYMEGVGRKFFSVIDPLARGESALVESVAEHRISSWGSIYYDLGIGIIFFAVGIYFLLRDPSNRNIFLLIFGLTALYFACSMVRLLILLAPAFALMASMGTKGILQPFVTLLKEPTKIVSKKRLGLEHVGKEFSGTAVFLIFLLLMTNFAFSPQSGGVPKVFSQADAPITITASSLPLAPSQPVFEWLDMVKYLHDLKNASIVVDAWWDYGYWLSILGNVTSLADNATINQTQIENVGFTFIANETQSIQMLTKYNAEYILVFTTIAVGQQTQQGVTYAYAQWAGYGDEGKWTWMARISGEAQQRFIDTGFIDQNSSWTDETKFGAYNTTTNQWVWNDVGRSTTIYKLMSWAKQLWCDKYSAQPVDGEGVDPAPYFTPEFVAGLALSPTDASKYGNLVPLVALYKINYDYPRS